MSKTQILSWSIASADTADAFERYLTGMADLYEVSGVSEHDRLNFFNETHLALAPWGSLGTGRSVRQTLSRGPATLRRSDVDGVNILINRAATVADCDGRSVRAAPGALQFRNLGLPSSGRMDRIDLLTLLVPADQTPRTLLEADMHGLVIPPDQPAVRLVDGLMRGVWEQAADLSDDQLDAAVQALMLVLTRLTGRETSVAEVETAALRHAVRRAAAQYVEGELSSGRATITAGALAAHVGVSRATLYRAFDDQGGVARYIQDRRLGHARSALRRRHGGDPSATTVAPIADIADAYGFPSASHFSRLFKARYGYSPSEVEAPIVSPGVALSEGPMRHDLLVSWLADLAAGQGASEAADPHPA